MPKQAGTQEGLQIQDHGERSCSSSPTYPQLPRQVRQNHCESQILKFVKPCQIKSSHGPGYWTLKATTYAQNVIGKQGLLLTDAGHSCVAQGCPQPSSTSCHEAPASFQKLELWSLNRLVLPGEWGPVQRPHSVWLQSLGGDTRPARGRVMRVSASAHCGPG